MTATGSILLVAGWAAGTLLVWRLPTPRRGGHDGPGRVSVVVPARDEEHTLPPLLASLGRQTRPADEVVVVDDGSTDRTADVAASAGAIVITAPPLPDGWAGKPWACQAGAEAATGDVLVLLDADVRLADDGLERLRHEHEARGADGLLSVQPFHEVHRIAEHASLVPGIVALMASGLGSARPASRPHVAFGPCLVTRADSLAAVGGFAAVRGEVLEDVALARRYEEADRPVALLAGGDAVRFRMYPSAGWSLVQGWAKGLAGGARRASPVPVAGAALWVCALVVAALGLRTPGAATIAAYVVTAGQVWWISRRVGSFHPLASVLFPLALAAFLGLFAWSVVQRLVLRRVVWRGRRYQVG